MVQFDLLTCVMLPSLSFNFICRSNRIRTVTIYYSFQHRDFPYPIILLGLSPRLLFFFLMVFFSNHLALDRPDIAKIRGAQILRNINHFIGGYNFFQTKRTYMLNEGEKMPFHKIVILVKLLLCKTGKIPSLFRNYYSQTHFKCCLEMCLG